MRVPTDHDAIAVFGSQLEALRSDRAVTPAFDAYIMVDWSARSKPATGRDSVWWAELRRPSRDGVSPSLEVGNPGTRELPARSDGRVVLTEIYPSLFHRRAESTEVHDRLQVIATALANLDAEGMLRDAFNAPAQHRASFVSEEGWILGVP